MDQESGIRNQWYLLNEKKDNNAISGYIDPYLHLSFMARRIPW